MRVARRILLAAGALLGLLLVAAALLLSFVDADRFRPRIARAVSEASGGELRLPEPLKIDLLPTLALRTGAGEFVAPGPEGTRAAPGAVPLARWRSLRIGARLVPLLRGRLEVGRIRIDGLELDLRRNAAGADNWEGLLAPRPGSGPRRFELESLAGLELREASLRYADARGGRGIALDHWRLELAAWCPGEPFDVATSFVLALPAEGAHAAIELGARAQPGERSHELQVSRWSAVIGDSRLRGSARLRLLAAATAGGGASRNAGAASGGPAAADAIVAANGQGTLAIESPSLRALLAALGIEAPATRDAQALGPLSVQSSWQLANAALTVEPLHVRLDGTNLEGRLQAQLAEPRAAEFALRGDSLDLTRYLEPEDAKGEPFELHAEALRALPVRGELRLERAQLAELRLKGVRLELLLEDGRLHRP